MSDKAYLYHNLHNKNTTHLTIALYRDILKSMIQRYLDQIKTIIRKYLPDEKYEIYLFGSRVKHADNPSADIDIGIEGPHRIDTHVLYRILHDIEESTIPYLVDVVDFKRSNERFIAIAKKEAKKL